MDERQELAKKYVPEINRVLTECEEREQEARKQKKDLKASQRYSESRIERVLDNYFQQLKATYA